MFIVLEGLDGAGKSTQVRKITDFFIGRGKSVEYLHFPRFDSPVYGGLIAEFLRGDFGELDKVHPKLVALLFAEDRHSAADMIRGWIASGKVVVLDRYVFSNMAYQCAKLENPEERKRLSEWIYRTEFKDFGIPKPDLNLFLDVPFSFVEKSLSSGRSGSDRDYLEGKEDIHESDMRFQGRVREMYLSCVSEYDGFRRIDCSLPDGSMASADTIFERIKTEMEKTL